MAGPMIVGHRVGLTGTFGEAWGRDAFASFFATPAIGFLKRPKEFTKKEAFDKILTMQYSLGISYSILIFGFTFIHECVDKVESTATENVAC